MRDTCLLPILLLLVAACAKPDRTAGDNGLSDQFKETCALSVREVLPDGTISKNQIIRPEHILRLLPGQFQDEGSISLHVELNAVGSKRMLSHSSNNVGNDLAIFCSETEVSRSTILEPFSDSFNLQVPTITGGT